MSETKPSIREIARRLQVHPSSVSRALTGSQGVSESTRQDVLALAREMGYLPDARARQLRLGRRAGLAIIVEQQPTDITSRRNYQMFRIGSEAFQPLHVLVWSTSVPLDEVVLRAAAESVTGIIVSGIRTSLSPSTIRQLRTHDIALVTVDGRIRGVDGVGIDRARGTREVVRLFELGGFRRPLYLSAGGPERPDERVSGIIDGYRSLGRPLPEGAVLGVAGREYDQGYDLADHVVRGDYDAVFCYNDRIATGLIRGLHERQRRIPEDCSVVGFDDAPFAAYLPVPLTTVAQPTLECAVEALEMLKRRIASPGRPAEFRLFETHLFLRSTTKAISQTIVDAVREVGVQSIRKE